MPIRSDNRPHEKDVSFWLEGKSDNVLRDACRLVDFFRKKAGQLSEDELQRVSAFLFDLIFDGAKIVAFAHENDSLWSREWVDLMFEQGSERYIEFNQHITGEVSIDTPPLKYPASIHKSFELLSDIEMIIRDNKDDKSFVRAQILEKSNNLMEIKREVAFSLGDKLKYLVDEQAVYVQLDWQDFCKQVLSIVQDGNNLLRREAEESIISWIEGH